jgi:hypothetical protein
VTWNHQKARWGNQELLVWKEEHRWIYAVNWHSDTAITTVGKGSAQYVNPHEARHAAVLHLASILSKPQAKRLSEQGDLSWVPWFDNWRKIAVALFDPDGCRADSRRA